VASKNDLRDSEYFGKWVEQLADSERELMSHAAVEYLPLEDTLRMVFTHAARDRLESKDACERLLDQIRAFYDVARQQWIRSGRSRRDLRAPMHVIMPRVELQLAPEGKVAH